MRYSTWRRERILVLVKAYPQPSQTYGESVCAAGLTSEGKWIRLYPVEFRNLPPSIQFSKWTWVEADIKKSTRDPRPESYNINHDTISKLYSIDTRDSWRKRRELLLPLLNASVEELRELHSVNGTSIGLIKPKQIIDFVIEATSKEWEPEKLAALERSRNQQQIFTMRNQTHKILEKVPYKFSYTFVCDYPACEGHKLQVLDWEVYQSFRSWRKDYCSEERALGMIRAKYLEEFTQKCELHFILGTIKSMDRFGTFSIIGLFYPPKMDVKQLSLF